MIEINKLRTRLKNSAKNNTEYRMTIKEASALLNEIENLIVPPITTLPPETTKKIIVHQPQMKILDGGTF